jgi:hypothetical protein
MWARSESVHWGNVDTSERIVVKREPRERRPVGEKRRIVQV